jgi:hypothetical protein
MTAEKSNGVLRLSVWTLKKDVKQTEDKKTEETIEKSLK